MTISFPCSQPSGGSWRLQGPFQLATAWLFSLIFSSSFQSLMAQIPSFSLEWSRVPILFHSLGLLCVLTTTWNACHTASHSITELPLTWWDPEGGSTSSVRLFRPRVHPGGSTHHALSPSLVVCPFHLSEVQVLGEWDFISVCLIHTLDSQQMCGEWLCVCGHIGGVHNAGRGLWGLRKMNNTLV